MRSHEVAAREDIERYYRIIHREECSATQNRRIKNGNDSKNLVEDRLEVCKELRKKIIADTEFEPTKAYLFTLPSDDPKELPFLEARFKKYKDIKEEEEKERIYWENWKKERSQHLAAEHQKGLQEVLSKEHKKTEEDSSKPRKKPNQKKKQNH